MGESPSSIRKNILIDSTNDQGIIVWIRVHRPSKTLIYNPTIRKLSLNGIHSKIVRVETTN
jgi:hypothetical protein